MIDSTIIAAALTANGKLKAKTNHSLISHKIARGVPIQIEKHHTQVSAFDKMLLPTGCEYSLTSTPAHLRKRAKISQGPNSFTNKLDIRQAASDTTISVIIGLNAYYAIIKSHYV
jgi:hypothetical protein